uniref:Uncharacterized protein n=1 Tax=Lepeophtheirus salmonis TaxID=72036 RepID=A0A0K2SVT1_LEPSM
MLKSSGISFYRLIKHTILLCIYESSTLSLRRLRINTQNHKTNLGTSL